VSAAKNITITTVVLTVLLVSACKRAPSAGSETNGAAADTNAAPTSAYPLGKDFGVVLLTNRVETRLQLDDAKSCVIKPLLLDAQRVRLTMTLESRQADGTTRGLKVISVVARPDQPFQVDFGSLVFALTPQVVTNLPAAP
jgi:hypothetical protein